MKKILFLSMLIVAHLSMAQLPQHSKWQVTLSKTQVKIGETVDIVFSVSIDQDWYMYAVGDNPPHAQFVFEENGAYQLVGKIKEGPGIKQKFDDLLEMDVKYFEKKAEFRQTIKVLKANPVINVEFDGQICSQVNGQCVPLRKNFTINTIKTIADAGKVEDPKDTNKKNDQLTTKNPEIQPSASNKSASLEELEKEKSKLTKKDSKGNDESVEYLKQFVRKYGSSK